MVALPVNCVWMASGNNTRLSPELIRRTVFCLRDAKTADPWLRAGFRHPKLLCWVAENRGQLVWAALTLVSAWLAQGRPPGRQTLGMFEAWAEVISNPDKLLVEGRDSGLEVFARARRLVVRGSPRADQSVVRALLARKAYVLRLLLRPTADEWEAWIERAAIAEFDGGLSRGDAETAAWAELEGRRGEGSGGLDDDPGRREVRRGPVPRRRRRWGPTLGVERL